MAKYKDLVYMALDSIKNISDDAYYTEEHCMFLLDKYRAFLIKQKLAKDKVIGDSNYQTICLDLEKYSAFEGIPCTDSYLRSQQEIPTLMSDIGIARVYTDMLSSISNPISFVSRDRFKVVGGNKYMQNIIYATIGADNHLYLKSKNPQYAYLDTIKLTAVFEDAEKAAELQCDGDDNTECDVLDKEFPMESALIPPLLELVVKELTGVIYRPKDSLNDAADNLSQIANALKSKDNG